MRLLLDIHTFLWFVNDDPKLSATARLMIEDGDNEVLISVASIWEIAIKVSIGKLLLTESVESFVTAQIERNDLHLLPIHMSHAVKVATLPFHHRDPFDRLLVAQALVEGMALVSADRMFSKYRVKRIW
jgi:PIN domain nuclease of toxin-antitoxin system